MVDRLTKSIKTKKYALIHFILPVKITVKFMVEFQVYGL
jgi:hypothetical protein